MGALPYIAAGILVLVGAPIVFLVLSARGRKGKAMDSVFARTRDALARDAKKRLAQNPRDSKALLTLAEIALRE
jgi:hypothetical protein